MKQRPMQKVADDIKAELARTALVEHSSQQKLNALLLESVVNLANASAELLQRIDDLENRNPMIGSH